MQAKRQSDKQISRQKDWQTEQREKSAVIYPYKKTTFKVKSVKLKGQIR